MANNKNDNKNKKRVKKVKKNGELVKTITTETQDTEIVDVSLRAFIRRMKVNFRAEGLKPSTQVHFFFDDILMDDYVIVPRKVVITANDNVVIANQGFANTDVISYGANSGYVVQSSREIPSTANTMGPFERTLYVVDDDDSEFEVGKVLSFSKTGYNSTIKRVGITSGHRLQDWFTAGNDNTIRLSKASKAVPNNYWGTNSSNTITFIPSLKRPKGRAFKGYITGFNNVTQQLTLANTFNQMKGNNPDLGNNGKKIAWQIHPSTGSKFMTDAQGKISGTLYIPAGMFRVGDRIFRIIDNIQNDIGQDVCSTRAEYRFTAYGIKLTTQDTILRSVNKENRESEPQTIPFNPNDGRGGGVDPIAQTFFVSAAEYPNGMFLSAVDVFFSDKDPIIPISVQIRPTVNGYPHSYEIIDGSVATVTPDEVKTSTNGSLATKFRFANLVYLPPGEYALVVISDSNAYKAYVAELGEKILGTNRIVSEQPYMGSFFRSQNASTWDAVQLEDLKFVLYQAKFASSATVYMGNVEPLDEDEPGTLDADALYSEIWDDVLPNTRIEYAHSFDSGASYVPYEPGTEVLPGANRLSLANTSNGTYRLRATLTTNDTSVSPIIYPYSGKLNTIKNDIDDATIDSDDIVIVNGGSGYIPGANIELALTGDSGSGATLYAVANASGIIDTIYVGLPGSKYLGDISLFSSDGNVAPTIEAANGTGAEISINHETGPSGGPASAKYISRTVTLAEGFEAGDLRVWITAYKPTGTDVAVYYKVKNSNDSENFEDKSYVKMEQKTLSTLYSAEDDFEDAVELEFGPEDLTSSITYSTDTGTYNTFNQFSIKLVLTSNDTLKYPIVYDMRAVAVPGPDLN